MFTCSLQSGSNGNAIYVEVDGVRLLFDAGISGRRAAERLATHGRNIRDVDALILSHGHADHTRCAGVFQRLYQIPILATAATRRAMAPFVGKVRDVRLFQAGDTITFGAVAVHTIPTPHDATDSVAFVVEHENKMLGILTDLGHPFRALQQIIADLDAVFVESNYDPQMLADGPYTPQLKARIRGAGGHLSNDEAADLLSAFGSRRLRWVALAHLSAENNRPELALATHRASLGSRYPLHVASRYEVSPLLRV